MRRRNSFAFWVFLPVVTFAQSARLHPADPVSMPSRADCNSPGFWSDSQLSILNSTGIQMISHGGDQFSQYATQQVWFDSTSHLPMWIESVWQDSDGTLFGWYHHEPGGICPSSPLTAPRIGAVVSYDNGRSFRDLGIVLESGDPIDCSAKNGFFAGGNGDFSVILDRKREYFYFLFDNYGGDISGQGVAIARLAFEDRENPVGVVQKYFDGEWAEPGLGGRLTPIFRPAVAWQQADTDSFWGPSVHWNTYLESYVVLLNHACCKPSWPQEGIYVTFNTDLSQPGNWSSPVKILGKVTYDAGYYPQVLGVEQGETDTIAGRQPRLYVHGRSNWTIEFSKEPMEEQDPSVGIDDPPDRGSQLPQSITGRVRR